MTKLSILNFICCLYFCSCSNGSIGRYTTGIDTAQIINRVFSSKKIMEGIPSAIDTIYLIKSQKFNYYNSSWPKSAGKLKIIYIDDIPQNTVRPTFGFKLTDKPLRYIVARFSIKADSANVGVYGINHRMDYYYKLIKKSDDWQITWSSWAIE